MSTATVTVDTNPFVGPRALRPGEAIHGRDREIRRLTNLLVAERIVLLYSPSGAGKTSLIEAGLIPKLRQRRFQVSPVVRVSQLPAGQLGSGNRYLASTLQALEAGLRPADQRPVEELLELGLDGYVREWATQDAAGAGNELLIFDQFEEILVLDPGDTDEKRTFFRELGAVLEERGRWALFSMREDYIAGLDPYLPELPTRLHTRMRLDLLPPEAALRAVQMPAAAAGRPFQETAAEHLVHQLRLVQAQRSGKIIQVPGPFVEPLQLQVVCRRLWDALPDNAEEVTEADVERFARVDAALGDYYAEKIGQVADESGVPERAIREWFGEELVTDQGIRRQQQRGPGADDAAAEKAVRLLEDAHLVRAEARRGTRWLELAHDQLVEPLRANNAEWAREHLSTAQLHAQQWAAHGRSGDFLLTGRLLVEAREWAAAVPAELTELESSFLAASTEADADRRRRRRNTVLLRWLSVMLTVAFLFAGYQWIAADQARDEAAARAREALSLADAAKAAAEDDPLLALYDAEHALDQARTPEAEDALRQAMSRDPAAVVLPHAYAVQSVAFSPKGDRLLTSSWDPTLYIWDSRTGRQLYLRQYESDLVDAQFGPDDRTLLTVTGTGVLTVSRLDDPDGADLRVEGVAAPAAFTQDGSRVAVLNSEKREVRIFDLTTRTEVLPPLAGHQATINSVTFSADGRWIASASADGSARIWEVATGRQAAVLPGHEGGAVMAAFRPDTGAVATGDANGSVRIWTWPRPGPPIAVAGQKHGSTSVAFAPGGALLAYGDKSPRLIDSTTGETIRDLVGHASWTNDARFTPDGRRAVTASEDGSVRVWDLASGQPVTVLEGHQGRVWKAAIDPAGNTVATASGSSVKLFRLPEQQFLPTASTDWMLDALFLPGGQMAAAAGVDGVVRVWEVASGATLARLDLPNTSAQRIDVDRTGTYLAAAATDGTVSVWDWRRGTLEARTTVMASAIDVHFDPAAETLIVAGGDGVRTWRWRTAEEPEPLLYRSSLAAAYSPDGRYVAAALEEYVELWTPSGSSAEWSRNDHLGDIINVAFSKDGSRLVTASLDGTARIWSTEDGSVLATLEGHRGPVASAEFDDEGRLVVTGGLDGAVGVWDADTGHNLALMPRHADVVNSVQFSSGPEPRILSSSDDSTVRISACETCRPLDELRARAVRLLAADGRAAPPRAVAGDCFFQFSRYQQPMDCLRPHRDEVFAVLTHPAPADAPLPGSQLAAWSRESCRGEVYREYRGVPYDRDTEYYAWWSAPSSAQWDLGQRTVVCVVTPRDFTDRTSSAKAAR